MGVIEPACRSHRYRGRGRGCGARFTWITSHFVLLMMETNWTGKDAVEGRLFVCFEFFLEPGAG